MSDIMVDEPCPYCEDGYIQYVSCNEFDGPGNPSSRWFECDHCNGTGVLHIDGDQPDPHEER